jgi:FkbM family methyltransferase
MIIFQSIFIYNEYLPPVKIETDSLVIYDLGSNIGLASIWLSCVFPNSIIYGFEPILENYKLASLNFKSIKGNIFQLAIGVESGTTKMLIDGSNTGAHRLAKHGVSQDSHIVSENEVHIDSLQNLINSRKINHLPDFLKIDAEGSKLDILYSLGKYLSHVKCVVIEPDKDKFHSCVNFLKENGFDTYQHDNKPHLIWGIKA